MLILKIKIFKFTIDYLLLTSKRFKLFIRSILFKQTNKLDNRMQSFTRIRVFIK